ncbi:MAG: hypothetical protein EBY21_13775, partial [Alphaproteobacteria bacterium]|nr:hypothetical protein [Alphaproteobacteria bacterium]
KEQKRTLDMKVYDGSDDGRKIFSTLDLVDVEVTKLKAREQAMDHVRARFGKEAIVKGLVFSPHRGSRPAGGPSKASLIAPEDEED